MRTQLLQKDKDLAKVNKRITELEDENTQAQSEVASLTEELMALGHENEALQVPFPSSPPI